VTSYLQTTRTVQGRLALPTGRLGDIVERYNLDSEICETNG